MSLQEKTVVGIDVGSFRKGFHAVALRVSGFEPIRFKKTADLTDWCLAEDAQIVAIACPYAWSVDPSSGEVELALRIDGVTIQCFKCPAGSQQNPFYDWVFNGEKLYSSILSHYQLFDDSGQEGRIVIETFPNAIACALAGRAVPHHPLGAGRRQVLRKWGYDDSALEDNDFVDAALCALTARFFLNGRARWCRDRAGGVIVLPE